jgi:hypothetical protein
MTVLMINCVTLGMYQPCEDSGFCDRKCQILKVIDDVIYLYFLGEMIIKMIAMGVMGRGCYLQETWNKLDCFIVISGLIESALEYCLDVEKLNLSAIRTGPGAQATQGHQPDSKHEDLSDAAIGHPAHVG